jgi:serine/threonine-protein kinase RsbW
MDQTFELTIGSDITEIPAVSIRLDSAMKAAGFSQEAILDTQLAVEEAITNVIVHGYKNSGCGITIICRVTLNRAEIQLMDSAPAFNPLSLPEPDIEADVEERQIGGLGIYLLRQVMDEISYRYEDGKNILVLVKQRNE